jgi:hypothetical protein
VRALVVLGAAAASVALVAAYVALGGTDFRPSEVADPCLPRPVAATDSTSEAIERVVLSAADETACTLGVSREELVLALRSVDRLDQLAARRGADRDDLEEALRDGVLRALDEAESEELVGDRTAGLLRAAAERLPLGLLLALLRELR